MVFFGSLEKGFLMSKRRFEHANNPVFACAETVLLLPFGRRSFLPAIVDAYGGDRVRTAGNQVLDVSQPGIVANGRVRHCVCLSDIGAR